MAESNVYLCLRSVLAVLNIVANYRHIYLFLEQRLIVPCRERFIDYSRLFWDRVSAFQWLRERTFLAMYSAFNIWIKVLFFMLQTFMSDICL